MVLVQPWRAHSSGLRLRGLAHHVGSLNESTLRRKAAWSSGPGCVSVLRFFVGDEDGEVLLAASGVDDGAGATVEPGGRRLFGSVLGSTSPLGTNALPSSEYSARSLSTLPWVTGGGRASGNGCCFCTSIIRTHGLVMHVSTHSQWYRGLAAIGRFGRSPSGCDDRKAHSQQLAALFLAVSVFGSPRWTNNNTAVDAQEVAKRWW